MPAEVIYSRAELLGNVDRLRARLPFAKLHYALKACAEPPVLRVLHETGLSFEAASSEEFDLLLGLGVGADQIICGLPLKGPRLVRQLYDSGCRCFVFDCAEEFVALSLEAPDAAKVLRIHISDLDSSSARWGMETDQFDACLRSVPDFAPRIDGMTFHLSRNYRVRAVEQVLNRVASWLSLLQDNKPRLLNIGGGYRETLPPHLALKYDLDAFYATLSRRVTALRDRFGLEILAEPGRGVVESAGRLRTPAMQVRARGSNEIEVALELNIGTRPGAHPVEVAALSAGRREVLYDIRFHLAPSRETKVTCNFVDATCEYDVFYRLPLRRAVRPQEVLEFVGMGAYTTCLSSGFHGRSNPIVRITE